MNPPPAFPYVKTGAYALLDFDATYSLPRYVDLSLEFKNLLDDYSELAWGYPQAGRTFYLKTRMQSSNSHADYRWRQKVAAKSGVWTQRPAVPVRYGTWSR